MLTENFSYLTLRDAVKFVVGNMSDLARAEEIINEYGLTDRCRVPYTAQFSGDSYTVTLKMGKPFLRRSAYMCAAKFSAVRFVAAVLFLKGEICII